MTTATNDHNMAPQQTTRTELPDEPIARILALARTCSSAYALLTGAFRIVASAFACPYASLSARLAAEEIREDYHSGPTDPRFWKPSVERFALECLAQTDMRARLLRARKGGQQVAFLWAPLCAPDGARLGGVALVVQLTSEQQVAPLLERLGTLVRLAGCALELVGLRPEPRDGGAATAADPHDALARAAACTTLEQLAISITNSLRRRLNCEQVALGLIERRRARVVSISGLAEVRQQSPGVVALRAAMEECLDHKGLIVCQREADWSERPLNSEHRLHKQWQAAASGDAVASLPLTAGRAAVAVISFRRRSDSPFSREEMDQVRAAVEPYAPALLLAQRAHRTVIAHARDTVREKIAALLAPGRLGRRIAAGAAALALLWFLFGTMHYEVTVPCTVRPAQMRHLAAPFEGVLASADRLAGDVVRAGDLLCTLDSRDLELQRADLAAQLAVLEREKDLAMAQNNPAQVQVVLANQELARVRLGIVERRLEQARLVAPYDGLIVRGDLRTRVGSVLALGDPLFEIAPLDRWTLELEVPEHVAADLAGGLPGSFALHARPERSRAFRISHVIPAAEVRDTRNVFLAEADLEHAQPWMRPGMEGAAKVDFGRRRVWWVALHRVLDYLHLKLWL